MPQNYGLDTTRMGKLLDQNILGRQQAAASSSENVHNALVKNLMERKAATDALDQAQQAGIEQRKNTDLANAGAMARTLAGMGISSRGMSPDQVSSLGDIRRTNLFKDRAQGLSLMDDANLGSILPTGTAEQYAGSEFKPKLSDLVTANLAKGLIEIMNKEGQSDKTQQTFIDGVPAPVQQREQGTTAEQSTKIRNILPVLQMILGGQDLQSSLGALLPPATNTAAPVPTPTPQATPTLPGPLSQNDLGNVLQGRGLPDQLDADIQTANEDQQAREWARANPNDPRAIEILRRLGDR